MRAGVSELWAFLNEQLFGVILGMHISQIRSSDCFRLPVVGVGSQAVMGVDTCIRNGVCCGLPVRKWPWASH